MSLSRRSLRDLSESLRSESDRFTDLRLDLVEQDERGKVPKDAQTVLSVGGRWDRDLKAYVDEAEKAKVLGLHPGQLEPARAIAEWFAARARGEATKTRSGKPVFSVLLHGGRRAGKTDLGGKAGCCYAVALPGSYVWMISENFAKTEELERDVKGWIPRGWYDYLGAPTYKFSLLNGSVIWLRSAHDPDMLKQGRCDFAVLNEAQNMAQKVFATVRPATADNGGLTILCANPADKAIGLWADDYYEATRAGKRPALEYHLDAEKNPHVNLESLKALIDEVDERTYRREILGEYLPRLDVVFHAWSTRENVRPIPQVAMDVTRQFVKTHIGREEIDVILGMDFQITPYMCAVALKAFRNPDDPDDEPLLWYVDEVVVENANEEDLAAEIKRRGYIPERTAIIADASGTYQGGERIRGRGSFDILRKCGWRNIYTPDSKMERNPDVIERIKIANSRMKSASGKRHLFSAPENLRLNTALKKWENKHGSPYRKSEYAHLSDAASYPLCRFYPRRAPRQAFEYHQVKRPPIVDAWTGTDDED